jgi:hypothetical protein
MAQFVFSISGDHAAAVLERLQHPSGAPPSPSAAFEPRTLTGRWRSAEGETLVPDFPVSVASPAFVEFPNDSGEFQSGEVAPALSFSAERPAAAAGLDIALDGAAIAHIPLAALGAPAAALPAPSSHRVGPLGASLVVPVFAERFTSEPRFLGLVTQLRSWIVTQPPFDEASIADKLAFDAHFWPSNPTSGLFGTYDTNLIDGRLLYGDRQKARQLLAPWTGRGVSLILIDSVIRGGAGGQPGYSAWTSITGAPGEHWEAVGLHEIGHGLGLADEYLDDQRAQEWPAHLEPNISQNAVPSGAPWGTRATVGDTPAPTAALQHAALPNGTIGTFQGARYRADLYRSSETCLMRQTAAQFCPVCVAHIRKQLGG